MIVFSALLDDACEWIFKLTIKCDCGECDEPETELSMPLDDFRALTHRATVALGYVDSRIAEAARDEAVLNEMERDL